jgi:hypothetical protein
VSGGQKTSPLRIDCIADISIWRGNSLICRNMFEVAPFVRSERDLGIWVSI